MLGRDLGVLRGERLLPALVDDELVLEPLGIGEDERVSIARDAEPVGPEVERLLRADAPEDAVHHAGTGAPFAAPGYSKNVMSLPGSPFSSA